jgi:hypothetical protein
MSKKDESGVNTICPTCTTSLENDPALRFLHTLTAFLYKFCIAFLRKTCCDESSTWAHEGHGGTWWDFVFGVPEAKTHIAMPPNEAIVWVDSHSDRRPQQRHLTPHALELPREVPLTSTQCGAALQILAEILVEILAEQLLGQESLVKDIQEVGFEPRQNIYGRPQPLFGRPLI